MRLSKAWAKEFGYPTSVARRYMRNVRYWLAPQNYDYTKTKYQIYWISWDYTPIDPYEKRGRYGCVGSSQAIMAKSKKDAINILKKEMQKFNSKHKYSLPYLRNSDFKVELTTFAYT